jgi:large conductance mechanosensitive channel
MTKKEVTNEKKLTRRERRSREVKEVATKITNLNPLARPEAELVNEAIETVNKQLGGFADFLREHSVVGVAIGLVLGTQVKQLVDSIVANFINPFLGLILPGKGTLAEKFFTLRFDDKVGVFKWGAVVNMLISFVAVAILVYIAYKSLRLDKLAKKKEEDKKSAKKAAK